METYLASGMCTATPSAILVRSDVKEKESITFMLLRKSLADMNSVQLTFRVVSGSRTLLVCKTGSQEDASNC